VVPRHAAIDVRSHEISVTESASCGFPLVDFQTVTGLTFWNVDVGRLSPQIFRPSAMTYIGFILALLAAIGTYASLSTTDFGALAVVPAFFVMIVVLGPFAPKLN